MAKDNKEESVKVRLSDLSLLARHTLNLDTRLFVPTEDNIEIHLYREWLRTEFCPDTRCFLTWNAAEKVWVKEHDGKPFLDE